MDLPRILFISTLSTPFIRDDLGFLKRTYNVEVLIGSGFLHAIKIFLLCFKADIVFCWFASTYSFIAVLTMKFLRRNSVIVIGGVDVAKDEKIGYGIWLSPWKKRVVKYALKNADKIVAVDDSLAEKAKSLAEYNGKNIEIVPTGYDFDQWRLTDDKKEKFVLTVASINDYKRFLVKGIDVLFDAAKKLPNIKFIIIGFSKDLLNQLEVPKNVDTIQYLEHNNLLAYYQKAKVYCQTSRHEGMPNVLCEAMLCGCIPVATNVGASRKIIGDSGIVVPAEDAQALANGIQNCLMMPEEMKYESRKRIVERYSKKNRENELVRIIKELFY